ncbi:netrin receptor DSCAM-like protein, partial [Dinothrombium tinctorium]
PTFLHEPPSKVIFYNNSGAIISCSASGNPQPTVLWTYSDHEPNLIRALKDVSGLRYTRADGSLVFAPFAANRFNQEFHSRTYRCIASNIHGSIVSRNVKIRGGTYELSHNSSLSFQH